MLKKYIPTLLIVFALTLTACGLRLEIPVVMTPGVSVTDPINIPVPNTNQTIELSLQFGIGKLYLDPGSEALVSGTATYNHPDFRPEISTSQNHVRIAQGPYTLDGIPDLSNVVNEWELLLGDAPMELNIEGGAYEAEYDFGGLALTNLSIQDGASKVQLFFSEPNLAEMNLFHYQTGASNITLNDLANANFTMLQFEGGAGNYTLDFSGELKRSASVTIESGIGNITLIIPEGIPVQVTVQGGIPNVTFPPGWLQNDDVYTQTGTGPTLTIIVEIGAGNLIISH